MRKEQFKTKIFAIFLVFCMLAASMPLLAYAAEDDETDQMQQTAEADQGEDEAETHPSPEQVGAAEETVGKNTPRIVTLTEMPPVSRSGVSIIGNNIMSTIFSLLFYVYLFRFSVWLKDYE